MAPQTDLHAALKELGPIDQSTLPPADDPNAIASFLSDSFANAAFIVDTIPIPPAPSTTGNRPRSSTTSSTASAVSASAVRSLPPAPDRLTWSTQWKDQKNGTNPHNITIYKLPSKDSNGAWFARRSVHEGLSFSKFRTSLRREFNEGLAARKGREDDGMIIPPGVRGIGAERRVERLCAPGVGRVDVYHLSAQFPGPSAPRDFVTACLTTAKGYKGRSTTNNGKGREFVMVSRPLQHEKAPEQSGFVRGKYESIEFIREIIPDEEGNETGDGEPRRSMSTSNLLQPGSISFPQKDVTGRRRSRTVGDQSPSRKRPLIAEEKRRTNSIGLNPDSANGHKLSRLREAISAEDLPEEELEEEGKTSKRKVEFSSDVETDEQKDDDKSVEDDEDDETNPYPVEWIMLTRSDPGGSVPRFMVERGTPGSIIKDAEKFLNWAQDKVHHDEESGDEHEPEEDIDLEEDLTKQTTRERSATTSTTASSVTVSSTGSTLAPEEGEDAANLRRAMSNDESTSNLSFVTASSGTDEDGENCDGQELEATSIASSQTSTQPPSALTGIELDNQGRPRSSSQTNVALQKIRDEALKLSERTKTNRQKDDERTAREIAKEEERQRKLEEKHAREAAKREEKFKREQEKAEEKRRKEEEKIRERKRKLEEKDEKIRHEREKEDLKHEIEVLRKENTFLHSENDSLRKELEIIKAKIGAGSGGNTPPSRTSSQIALSGQLPASPASSIRSKK